MFPREQVIIDIVPSQIVASPQLRQLPIKDRDCKFPDENEDMEILNEYSQNGCFFECQLKRAREACGGCTPWDYPHPPGIFMGSMILYAGVHASSVFLLY